MTRWISARAIAVLAVAALVLAFAAGGAGRAENAGGITYRQLDLFGDVLERVRASYVEEVSDKELIEAAIEGMLSSLDPHSGYLSPESFDEMQVQTRGEFGGLGIEVTMEEGFVKVISPIEDTPADRAGIEAGDFVTHLDGESILGLTLGEAVERMRGEVGTDITLTVLREGADEALEITVTRDVITIRSVRWHMENQVGYLRIASFTEQTEDGMIEALEGMAEAVGGTPQGVVLDLRNNPGGLLEQAVAAADIFLERGEIVSTRGRHEASSKRFNARPGDLAEGAPVVVLINGGSASASEIVAGALQDHRRAVVMGTRSFGKGSVQTIVPLPGHGAMRMTTARYYTPAGTSIQAAGIHPDIVVEEATVADQERGPFTSEADLRNRLEGEGENGEAQASRRSERARADYQLARALDLLEGMALLQTLAAAAPGE